MRKRGFSQVIVWILLGYMMLAVIYPMARMFMQIGETDAVKILTSRSFSKALRQSLHVTLTATAISVSLAGILAWMLTRTRTPMKKFFGLVFTLPMLIPSISHGMGLVILLGKNGVLTNLLGLDVSIYGFWGIVAGSVMYSFPVAFLMIRDMLAYEDSLPYEAANVLGISKRNQFFAITLPYLRRPLINVIFCVFTMIITDYGVPLTVGGKYSTLPVVMYQDVIGLLDFGKGSLIGLVLLFPAVLAFLMDMFSREKGSQGYSPKPFKIRRAKVRDRLSLVFLTLAAAMVILPLATFLLLSFVKKYPTDMTLTIEHVSRIFQMNGDWYLLNSLIIGLAVGLLGVMLTTLGSYFAARRPGLSARVLHLISLSTLAVPGIVLGLSYALTFSGGWPYGTLAILIMVNSVHFFASPYLMIYNTFLKLNENLESVGLTLGVRPFNIFLEVLLPQAKETLLEMFAYLFVNCLMTISAVSFLANVTIKPLSLMINQFESQMMLESAAFVSLIILGANLLIKSLCGMIRKRMNQRKV